MRDNLNQCNSTSGVGADKSALRTTIHRSWYDHCEFDFTRTPHGSRVEEGVSAACAILIILIFQQCRRILEYSRLF